MSGRLTAVLMAFACCVAFCACGKNGSDDARTAGGAATGDGADAVVREVGGFTDELERAFESAPQPRDGVDAAPKLPDARRPGPAAGPAAVQSGPQVPA